MGDGDEEYEFNQRLCARVAELRKAKGWTQDRMAAILGIPLERYKKYETRTPLPHHLISRFADIVDRNADFVLTGRNPVIPAGGKPLSKKGFSA